MAREQRHIDRYRDAELIGRGGFGSVYRADDADHGRKVAIKVLDVVLGETERRRFDRERKLMGQLGSHPNIISVFDSGYTDDGEAFIVMELASAGSLQDELEARGQLPWAEAVELMSPIARAVAAAHRQGIVHRDIKPDNILIDDYANPRLTDFGIAALTSGATSTQAASATLAHAAPEVLDGKQGNEATDVYALGSTLHTLIAGTPPFMRSADEGLGVMMRRIMAEPPPDLRPLGVPDHVAAAIEASLQKDPDDRKLSADDFASAISGQQAPSLGDHPTITEPTPFAAVNQSAADHPAVAPVLGATPALAIDPDRPLPFQPSVGGDDPTTTARDPSRVRWLLAAGLVALLAIGGIAFALMSNNDNDIDVAASTASTESTTGEASTSTTAPVSTSVPISTTVPVSVAAATEKSAISIDCPTEVALGATLTCSITTSGVVSGEWKLPGFLAEPLPIQTINAKNEIFLEPTQADAAGRRYTITATATTEDGSEITARRQFLIPTPTVTIDCPSKIAPGDSVVCDIVSRHATSGTWEIPGFGGDIIETVPGSSAIFINPNESVVGQTFTATADVVDDFTIGIERHADMG